MANSLVVAGSIFHICFFTPSPATHLMVLVFSTLFVFLWSILASSQCSCDHETSSHRFHFPFTCTHRSNARKSLFILMCSFSHFVVFVSFHFILSRFLVSTFRFRGTKATVINLWLLTYKILYTKIRNTPHNKKYIQLSMLLYLVIEEYLLCRLETTTLLR